MTIYISVPFLRPRAWTYSTTPPDPQDEPAILDVPNEPVPEDDAGVEPATPVVEEPE